MKQRFRSGGVAGWAISHPIGVIMLTLTVVVIGLFSLQRLNIDLLPNIIYPDVRVRIIDDGVPAQIMEDTITRQLEEQLAITEGAIQVQSNTREGRSAVDLSFPYGSDIDLALRDASTRLDRAKRFLPTDIDPPVIYKRDPSQLPVMEFVLSSSEMSAAELRGWADYTFSKWFINLPGVAAMEIGGGVDREIQVIPDQERLASIGLSLTDLSKLIQNNNEDAPGGRLINSDQEISTRSRGRYSSVDELRQLPVWLPGNIGSIEDALRLEDVAEIRDASEDERLRVRLDTLPGVKISVQKLPLANTVEVVDEVTNRMASLRAQGLLPDSVRIAVVGDQSSYVRNSLQNASMAAISGATLAMLVIYLFLGNLKRTLIIGTAIPIGILVTFTILDVLGLTLNIMTLGGLALGMGLLIDSTIVMLENITRHQDDHGSAEENALTAAGEVNSPIVASTATNLAAILPFLLIGGLTGLLFEELIITITSAMVAAMIVALTLVPALGANIKIEKTDKCFINNSYLYNIIKVKYNNAVRYAIRAPLKVVGGFSVALVISLFLMQSNDRIFMPDMDEGDVTISVTGETGTNLDEMDATVEAIENLLLTRPEVDSVFTMVGGFIFGRSEYERSNRSTLKVRLVPVDARDYDSREWTRIMEKEIQALELTGFKINLRIRGIRGIRMSSGDDDLSLRVQGEDIEVLTDLANRIVDDIQDIEGLKNLTHTYEEQNEELNVVIDRQRAADLGITANELGDALRIALDGRIISDFIEGDRQYNIRLRLPRNENDTPDELANLLVGINDGRSIRLHEVAHIERGPAPATIMRDQQQRIVEISASLGKGANLLDIMEEIEARMADFEYPTGYTFYDGGAARTLKENQSLGRTLLALAIFLVLVVMAVQYESLRDPLVILFSIPFAIIGVAIGVSLFDTPLSMSVWLGLIMLAGIVVNNAIVLVEQIEIQREHRELDEAIATAASLRFRPILMTTITTVFGMLPLAIGLGEGSEMLQPLAFVIVWGLSFSMLVSLILIPAVYHWINSRHLRT